MTQENINQFGVGGQYNRIVGPPLASAPTINPTHEIHHVTGTATIQNITPPWPSYQGTIYLIADGAWSLAPGGNIATAATASVSESVSLTYDGVSWCVASVASGGSVTNVATAAPITGGPITGTGTIGISDFVGSGASHARGGVPDPGGSAGSTKFLREDAAWAVPLGTVPTGTGFYHVTGGSLDAAAKLVDTADINAAQVTFAKLQNSAALSVHGRATNSSGVPADISASAGSGTVLLEASSALTFGQVTTLGIADNAVTNAKAAQMAGHTYKGNNTGSTANATDITATQLTADLNAATATLQGMVPTPPNDTTKFLRGDATWAVPSGGSVPTGTGFYHVTSGSMDAASVTVDLSGAHVTGTLAAARFLALTGDVTNSAGAVATTIANNAVTNAKAAQMAAHTFKGNNTGSTANAIDLTQAQLTADLNACTSSLQGLVPAPPNDTTKFLRGDGTFTVLASGFLDKSTFWLREDFQGGGRVTAAVQNNELVDVLGGYGWRNFFIGGSGEKIDVDGFANHPGVRRFFTGTTTTGGVRACLADNDTSSDFGSIVLGNGAATLRWIVRVPTVSDGTDTFLFRVGLGNSPSTAAVNDGVYLDNGAGTNNVNWRRNTIAGGTATQTTTATAVGTGWHVIDIIVNSAGTSVDFQVDGSSIGTNTTNIPTTNAVAPYISMVKTAGTTSRELQADLMAMTMDITR